MPEAIDDKKTVTKLSDEYLREVYDVIGIRIEERLRKSVITLEVGQPIKINEIWYPLEEESG